MPSTPTTPAPSRYAASNAAVDGRPAAASATTAPGRNVQPVVVCEHLTKVFRDFWMRSRVRAVDGVTFHIDKGEIFGLLGPNGSGKSTTIKIILGLLHKTSGRVSIFGKLPTDVRIKRRIGYLPEESYLYPFLNARETLDYYGKLFELSQRERKRRIDELLDMVGLTAVQFRPVREYSKGMARRIGIAQALINDPELLILDEPTTGLDPIGTRQIKDLILELGRRGKTVLLSSHLLSDVEDCVDRMVILYGGKIQREGTCDSLLQAHEKSIIETDVLDDETISEIDRVIRQRSGGTRAVTRVSHPRQRLEDLFISIVEEARAKKIQTHGAQHGGQTAAFLRADEDAAPRGEELLSSLVQAGQQPPEPEERDEPVAAEPAEDVLGSLLAEAHEEEPTAAESPLSASEMDGQPDTAAAAQPAADIDAGVIDSLMDIYEENGESEGGSKREGA